MSNQVVHFEIPAEDLQRAKAFYAGAFGWTLNEWGGGEYVMVSTTETDEQGRPSRPGAINGGMFKREAQLEHPVITIDVADIDAALQTVAEKGGKVVRGSEPVGEMGYAAYFTDPEGNVMGLWQSRSPA